MDNETDMLIRSQPPGGTVADFRKKVKALLSRPAYTGVFAGASAGVAARAVLRQDGPVVEFLDSESAVNRPDSRETRVSLPRRLFIVKDVLLPGSDTGELAGMIAFELPDLFPIAVEDLVWDWYPRVHREDGYTVCRVLGLEAACVSQTLQRLRLSDAGRMGVEPSTVTLANYYRSAEGSWPEKPLILAAVTSDGLDLALVGPDGLVCDRGATFEGEADAARIASEVTVFLSMCDKEAGAPGAERMLFAGGSVSAELMRAVEAGTGLSVESMSFQGGVVPETDSTDELLAAAAAFAPPMREGLHVNLAPPEQTARRKMSDRIFVLSAGALLVVVTVFLAFLALSARANRLEGFVDRLESRIAEISPGASEIDAKRKRLSAIERQLAGQGRVLNVLVSLYKVTPVDISLTSVDISSEGLLTIKGHAQRLYQASEYAAILEKNPIFGRPAQQTPWAYQRTESGKTFISFTIVRDLAGMKGQ